MKILLTIHHHLDLNAGAPGVTWRLGQEYQKLGHEVQYYTFDDLPSRLPELSKGIIFPEFVAYKILSLSRKQAVDLVDASTGDAWVWSKISSVSQGNRPCLITRSHGLEHTAHTKQMAEAQRGNLRLSWKYPLYHGGFRLWEVASSMRSADLVLLLNRYDAQYAVEKLGVKSERIRITANGLPESFLNLPFEPILEAENSTIGIAQIGRYTREKGVHYSTPGLNTILARHPKIKVSFLGTGCSEEEVYADFETSMRDRLRVVPRYTHETLPVLLKGHQIKLFPTITEGFGLALIEAMACGLAPVTTATPGPMEIVHDGHNGILIPVHDSQAIVQALEKLITDHLYLEQLRCNAYATAQRYSWACIARDNLIFYEEALSKGRCSF